MWTSTSRIPTIRTIIDLRHRLQTTATTIRSHVDEAMRAQKISKNEMVRLATQPAPTARSYPSPGHRPGSGSPPKG